MQQSGTAMYGVILTRCIIPYSQRCIFPYSQNSVDSAGMPMASTQDYWPFGKHVLPVTLGQ